MLRKAGGRSRRAAAVAEPAGSAVGRSPAQRHPIATSGSLRSEVASVGARAGLPWARFHGSNSLGTPGPGPSVEFQEWFKLDSPGLDCSFAYPTALGFQRIGNSRARPSVGKRPALHPASRGSQRWEPGRNGLQLQGPLRQPCSPPAPERSGRWRPEAGWARIRCPNRGPAQSGAPQPGRAPCLSDGW